MRAPLFCIMATLFACSSQPAPAWQSAAHTQLANFTESYLAGDIRTAGLHFEKAIGHTARTGDPALVGRVELTRCALAVASLEETPCDAAKPYLADPANAAYHALLTGGAPDPKQLPDRYRDLAAAIAARSQKKVRDAVTAIDDPLSRLVAVGVAARQDLADTATLEAGAKSASENGWKKPLSAYLQRLKALYEQSGDSAKSTDTETRLDILKAP